MYRFYSTGIETIAAAILLIPVFFCLNGLFFRNKRRAAACFVLALYLSAMYAVAGLPHVAYFRFAPKINLEPFAYMFSDYMNSLLNVVLFLPLGCFLPVLWADFKQFGRTFLCGLCVSLTIEVLQLFSFRATDINDIMTNTLGTVLGYLIGRIILKCVPRIRPGLETMELYLVMETVFLVMFFLQPFVSDLVWAMIR